MGETRVDLLHLLEDLRDAYPGATEETILTEIVANSLDSGATTITITTDPTAPALTIVDDGMGMRRRELARYHDIAASTKVRGERIGFAGVGIKVGLLVSREVLTETRLGKHHVATSWGLSSRHRAPWRWVAPPGPVVERGPAGRLARKRKPAAAGYMVRDHLPIPEERRGIAVSTFGKVIKRGWDWLGVTPGAAEHVGGLIEVPDLAECLTLNKADFVRGGPRGAT